MSDGPQIENGNFTRIHNEIMEALAGENLSGAEFRCLLVILRKTYGWQKKQDAISYGQIADLTGLTRRSVIRAMKRLEERQIVVQSGSKGQTHVWKFNKYSHKWSGDQVVTSTGDQVVTRNIRSGDQVVTSTGDQMDTNTGDQVVTHKRKKETIKERERTPVGDYIRYYLDNVTETRQQFPTGIEQNTIRRLAQTATLEEWKAACDKTGRQRRGDPLAYIEAVLDGKRAEAAPATVDFDWGAMTE